MAAICQRLDGLPLAIELAAARMALFAPSELLAQLDQRFVLLTGGAVDLPARQQTLRRAIDWSYELLDAHEQALFYRLGVFVGGCTLAAASAVCGSRDREPGGPSPKGHPSRGPAEELGVFDGIAALIDKSLLQREGAADGQSRFTMLETIREYALERLEASGEARTVRRRHAEYCVALAESAEPELFGRAGHLWLDRLEQEHDNLRTALAWCRERAGESGRELRLAGALADFWLIRGHHSEGRQWLAHALAGADASAHERAELGASAGAPPPASAGVRAKALHGAGKLAHVQEDACAEALFDESLALARALGDPHRIARVLNDLSELALHQGELDRATALCAEGLALARAADDRSAVAQLLLGLGNVVRAQGDVRSAAAYYEESRSLYRALSDRHGSAWTLYALGALARAQEHPRRAAELFAEGLAQAREVGDQESTGWLLYQTGRLMLEQHELAGAAARFGESARLLQMLGSAVGVASSLIGLAAALVQCHQLAQAARLLSVAERQPWDVLAAERAEYDRTVAAARVQLGEARFAAMWAEGRMMSLEQAMSEALDSVR